jgi:hypothetical protein
LVFGGGAGSVPGPAVGASLADGWVADASADAVADAVDDTSADAAAAAGAEPAAGARSLAEGPEAPDAAA